MKRLRSILVCSVVIVTSVLVVGVVLAKASSSYIPIGEVGVANGPHVGYSMFMLLSTSTGTVTPALTDMMITTTLQLTEAPTTTVTWASWTATTTSAATTPATYMAGVRSSPSSPLLDRLIKNKPSIWGNEGFYVVLGVLYLTLLGLFLKQILDTVKRRP